MERSVGGKKQPTVARGGFIRSVSTVSIPRGQAPTLPHAGRRTASSRLSHSPIWFQLTKMRLTTLDAFSTLRLAISQALDIALSPRVMTAATVSAVLTGYCLRSSRPGGGTRVDRQIARGRGRWHPLHDFFRGGPAACQRLCTCTRGWITTDLTRFRARSIESRARKRAWLVSPRRPRASSARRLIGRRCRFPPWPRDCRSGLRQCQIANDALHPAVERGQ